MTNSLIDELTTGQLLAERFEQLSNHNEKRLAAEIDAAISVAGIDRWKLAKWLYDMEAEVDSHGVQLADWDSRGQPVRDAYYKFAGECLDATAKLNSLQQ